MGSLVCVVKSFEIKGLFLREIEFCLMIFFVVDDMWLLKFEDLYNVGKNFLLFVNVLLVKIVINLFFNLDMC